MHSPGCPRLLARLHQRGRIDRDMREAGARFHLQCRQGTAAELIELLGGADAAAARAMLAIVGEGMTITAYARSAGLRPEVVEGLLLAGLSVLAGHASMKRRAA